MKKGKKPSKFGEFVFKHRKAILVTSIAYLGYRTAKTTIKANEIYKEREEAKEAENEEFTLAEKASCYIEPIVYVITMCVLAHTYMSADEKINKKTETLAKNLLKAVPITSLGIREIGKDHGDCIEFYDTYVENESPYENTRLFYDLSSNTYFEVNYNDLLKAIVEVNDDLNTLGYTDMKPYNKLVGNDYPCCDTVFLNDIKYIMFHQDETITDDGLECTVIDIEPVENEAMMKS